MGEQSDWRAADRTGVAAVGVTRRLTTFGSVALVGRGRVEVLSATQDAAAFELSLQALEARHQATGRDGRESFGELLGLG